MTMGGLQMQRDLLKHSHKNRHSRDQGRQIGDWLALTFGGDVERQPADCAAVEAHKLTIVRGRMPVLDRIDLTVQQGEKVAFMGPNGAGKSTLLKCLAGAVRPSGGHICWLGRPQVRCAQARQYIGFVGHECGLYRELTVLENLVFAARMQGVKLPHQRAMLLLVEGGLEWAAEVAVAKLSQGICRRLAILRALVNKPTFILLDEPYVNLDENGRHWLDQRFGQWRREEQTVCLASHDVSQSRAIADRIVWLECGRVRAQETCRNTPAIQVRSA
jgi:ABC-type multidrug transport system ATPase subunit